MTETVRWDRPAPAASVIVGQSSTGGRLSAVRIVNDPDSLALQLEDAGEHPEVVLEATYGRYFWASQPANMQSLS